MLRPLLCQSGTLSLAAAHLSLVRAMLSTSDISDPGVGDPLARSVNRLSIAIWVLSVLVAANLVIALLALFSPALLTKRMLTALPEQFASSESLPPNEYNN